LFKDASSCPAERLTDGDLAGAYQTGDVGHRHILHVSQSEYGLLHRWQHVDQRHHAVYLLVSFSFRFVGDVSLTDIDGQGFSPDLAQTQVADDDPGEALRVADRLFTQLSQAEHGVLHHILSFLVAAQYSPGNAQ
jgi:hypothetical protein